MTKAKRILLISCSVILLCMSIIAGMTYALFSEDVSVRNHLQAGDLDVTLKRTNLEYSVLDEEGYLKTTVDGTDIDLTTSTDENVFGLKSSENLIVPGSKFNAQLTLTNDGNVAFEYGVKLITLTADIDKELAKQIKVTVTDCEGNKTVKMLNELTSDTSIFVGEMKRNPEGATAPEAHVFYVLVEFLDDEITENGMTTGTNNNAQAQYVAFDLIVEAVQATK